MKETMEFSKKFGLDLDSEIVAIDLVSSDDEEEEEEGEKKKKKDVVVIDLLSSSDEEKEDAKENKRKSTGKHPRQTGKCMCCSFGEFCQNI